MQSKHDPIEIDFEKGPPLPINSFNQQLNFNQSLIHLNTNFIDHFYYHSIKRIQSVINSIVH